MDFLTIFHSIIKLIEFIKFKGIIFIIFLEFFENIIKSKSLKIMTFLFHNFPKNIPPIKQH